MKDLGTEFCKAKTAVEIRYHPVSQDAAWESSSAVDGPGHSPHPLPLSRVRARGDNCPHTLRISWRVGEKCTSPAAALPSPPAPLPSTGEGRESELLLIDSILDDKTVAAYDKPWSAIRPREVPLGWRAAGIVVHPTNPVSVISFRQLRDVFSGKIKDWGEVGEAGSGEQGAGSTERGVGTWRWPRAQSGSMVRRPKIRSAGWWKRSWAWAGSTSAILPRSDAGKVILTVARDPMALGVVDLAEMPPGEASVKMLAISPPGAGRAPPARELPPGYPLIQPVGMWVSGQAARRRRILAISWPRASAPGRSSGTAWCRRSCL